MKQFLAEDFERHLIELGLRPGRNILVHSRLLSFGRCSPDVALSALLNRIGPTATLAVPTYVFSSSEPYDRSKTASTGMGSLSEQLRHKEGAVRSRCPVHNHTALGPKAHILDNTNFKRSFGHDTDFHCFTREDFDLVLLGCTFGQAATFLHHVETLAEVPYRKWVDSPKEIVVNGKIETIDFKYFARIEESPIENFQDIVHYLDGIVQTAKAPYGTSYRISLRELEHIAIKTLQNDPYALVQVQ